MTEKRRKVARVATSIPVEWGVMRGYTRHGKIISLSSRGCLIRTDHIEPLYGKTIYLRFPLPDDEWMELEAQVVYYLREVGFAVEFAELTDQKKYLLSRLIENYSAGDPYQIPGAAPLDIAARADAPQLTFKDHRKYSRITVSINLNWGATRECVHDGDRITRLSLGGCFIQTERKVKEGSVIYLRLWKLPGGKGVFRGIVRYQLQLSAKYAPIGFGVEFSGLDAEETARLREVLAFYGEPLPT